MASLNKVLLIGNLTRPPELRYTPSGTAVADLRLAVNRNYTTQTGEKREEACFLTVIVWGKQAETCGEYLDKGSQVFVEGRIGRAAQDALRARGFDVRAFPGNYVSSTGRNQLIVVGPDGAMSGASDPRRDGGVALASAR